MDVIISRYIGIRGTAIMARARYDELKKRYPEWFLVEAMSFDEGLDDINELPEIGIAMNEGASYAKGYTEFGIFEALFQMSKELRCGLRIRIKDIPIKQETVEVCEELKCNPYALFAGGSSVIVCENGEVMKEVLEKNGIPASIVGHTNKDNDKIVINEDEESFLPHIRKDEMKNVLGRKEYNDIVQNMNSLE